MNKTEIANAALQALGVSFIISDFDNDNSNHAKIIRRTYQTALDEATESSEWSFATKFKDLNLVGDGIVGWRFKYSLPADCLVLRQIGKQDYFINANIPHQFLPSWQFNNSAYEILSNVEEAWGKYTRRIIQDEEVPNYFGDAVAARLAWKIAPAIIGDKFAAIKNTLASAIKDDMDRAIAYDSGRQPDNRQQVSSYELLLQ